MKLSLIAKIIVATPNEEIKNFFRNDSRFHLVDTNWPPNYIYVTEIIPGPKTSYADLDSEGIFFIKENSGILEVGFEGRPKGLLVEQLEDLIKEKVAEINLGNLNLLSEVADLLLSYEEQNKRDWKERKREV